MLNAAAHRHLPLRGRPRGYAEIRLPDAVEPEWYAAPVALLSGLLYHPASLREADALLGAELEVAREFYARYTRAGRAPADDLLAVSAR